MDSGIRIDVLAVNLSYTDHDRNVAGLTYVYPVVSRRAKGLSIGVNLNPNNACNIRCIYCQVPDLRFGKGPEIDVMQLENELRFMLERVVHGEFLKKHVPKEARRLNDVALSGNGEPTSSPRFREAIEAIARALEDYRLINAIKIVLITNGTMMHKPAVQQGVMRLGELNGEVWFKLDSATREGLKRIHSIPLSPVKHLVRLRRSAEMCSTWIHTCLFAQYGKPPSQLEQGAYLECLRSIKADSKLVRGVYLYSLARPSLRPEAETLSALPRSWLIGFAERARSTGMPVEVA